MSTLLQKLKEKVKDYSRKKKYDQFYSFCKEECRVLDVGIAPETTNPKKGISSNHFLKQFKFDSSNYVGLSIDSLKGMEKKYPGKKFVDYDGGRFPFEDKEFDWTHSNAVIEHVGTLAQKLHFIKEMVRVSKNVYFTTPNKYFPVDAHTLVFFIHWNDALFMKWRKWKNTWIPKERLNLLSLKEIKTLLKQADIKNYKIIKNRLMGITMTFTIVIMDNDKKEPSTLNASGSARKVASAANN